MQCLGMSLSEQPAVGRAYANPSNNGQIRKESRATLLQGYIA